MKLRNLAQAIAAIVFFSSLILPNTSYSERVDPTLPGCGAFTEGARLWKLKMVNDARDSFINLAVPVTYFDGYFQKKGTVRSAITENFYFDFDTFSSATQIQERSLGVVFDNIVAGIVQLERKDIPLERWVFSNVIVDNRISVLPSMPPLLDGPAGLKWLQTERSSASENPVRDHFVELSDDGDLRSYLRCTSHARTYTVNAGCQLFFKAEGFDFSMSFDRTELDRWHHVRDSIEGFFSCAKASAEELGEF